MNKKNLNEGIKTLKRILDNHNIVNVYASDLLEHLEKVKDSIPMEAPVILPKPNPQVFTLSDLKKAYDDGYKNGIMNEAGLECEPFNVWYNWVHIIKSKNQSEA